MGDKKTSFLKGAAILGVAGIIVKLIGALFRIPLQNTIGAQGMANYEVAYPIYSLLLVISSSGLPTAISKLVAERMATGRPGAALYVFKSSRRLLLLIGTVCSAALLAAAGVYAAAVGMPDSKYAIMGIAPALLAVAVMCAYRGYFQGMQNMGATAVSQLIEQIGKLLLGLTLAKKFMALGAGYAALGATIGIAVSEFAALAVIMLMYAFRRKSPIKPLIHQTENFSQLSKKLLAIAVPITIGAAIMPLTGVMDSLTIVNELKALGFAQEAAQSAYAMLRSVVTPIINLPAVLTIALAMSIVPAISSQLALYRYSEAGKYASGALKLAFLIGIPCSVGLYLMAENMIKLLFTTLTPAQTQLATSLLKTSAVGVVFLSLVQTTTGMLQGAGDVRGPVVNLAVGSAVKIILLLTLIRVSDINIQGAAISTVACYGVAALLDLIRAKRKLIFTLDLTSCVLKPALCAAIMGALIYVIAPLWHTIIVVALGALTYIGLIMAMRVLREDDFALLPGGARLLKGLKRLKLY